MIEVVPIQKLTLEERVTQLEGFIGLQLSINAKLTATVKAQAALIEDMAKNEEKTAALILPGRFN